MSPRLHRLSDEEVLWEAVLKNCDLHLDIQWFQVWHQRFSFYHPTIVNCSRKGCRSLKDKILCFVCAVKNIERTFDTYYELQDHLYKDHDMKKDPAMEIFNKYRSTSVESKGSTT